MTTLEQKLQTAEALFSEKIETNSFFNILFEMNRYFDKQFVILLHNTSEESLRLNQNERNLLRKYYYYGVKDWLSLINVSNFLGHSDISTTANIYSHLDMKSIKDVSDTITAVFEGTI